MKLQENIQRIREMMGIINEGNNPHNNLITESIEGKIHINDHHYHQDTIKNDVAVFDTINDFIKGIGYEKMLN